MEESIIQILILVTVGVAFICGMMIMMNIWCHTMDVKFGRKTVKQSKRDQIINSVFEILIFCIIVGYMWWVFYFNK